MKTIEQFYNEAKENEALACELDKACMEECLQDFLTKHNVNGTAEEFEAFISQKKATSRELSDDELENASGGVDWECAGIKLKAKDVVFEFKIGDSVKYDGWFKNYDAVVIDRRAKEVYANGTWYIPYYSIRFDDDFSTKWVTQDYLAHR
ncbi:MAG: hypothetical protein ACI4WS_14540 [Oscillospiraceae bacterium]